MKHNILHTHKELVEASKTGDRNAQFQLYELYVDAMYNICMRMIGNKEDAEDILQDSFIKAFENLSSFRYESTFGSWLKKIVIHKCINHLKSKKIPVTLLENNESEPNEEFEENIDHLNISKIKNGITQLPDGYKQIINLYLIEGYDHVEISEILGISISTSKSQYHRAKKKLIQIINSI